MVNSRKIKTLGILAVLSSNIVGSSLAQTSDDDADASEEQELNLIISNQKIGPFGLYQNSADKPKVDVGSLTNRFKKPERASERSLAETLSSLKINGVNPSRGEFIIGLNRYRLGQILPLTKTIEVKVIKVTSSSISFENTANKESATLDIGKRNLLRRNKKNLNNLLTPNGASTPLLQE